MNILEEKANREKAIKANLYRLDKCFMKELWRKYYGMEYSLSQIKYISRDGFVKVSNLDGSEYIVIWADPFSISTADINVPPEMVWDILNRIKTCKNCKFWDKDDMSCAKSGDSLHENNHGFSQKTSDNAFLYIDDDVIDVEIKDGCGGFKPVDGYFDADDVEKVVTVCFGENHSCGNHEYKEDK